MGGGFRCYMKLNCTLERLIHLIKVLVLKTATCSDVSIIIKKKDDDPIAE